MLANVFADIGVVAEANGSAAEADAMKAVTSVRNIYI